MVRAGKSGDHAHIAISENIIVTAWDELPDLSRVEALPQLRALIANAYHDISQERLNQWTGELWRFTKEIDRGDLVALPYQRGTRFAFGRVVGPYMYSPDAAPGTRHRRAVEWLDTDVPKTAIDSDLRQSFNSWLTVCRIRRNGAEERIGGLLEQLRSKRQDHFVAKATPFKSMLPPHRSQAKIVLRVETASGMETPPRLTTRYLGSVLVPYLTALSDLQEIVNSGRRESRDTLAIVSISRQSPVEVSLEGAGEVIEKVRDEVIPWRRKHLQEMARLEQDEKRTEIKKQEAELLEAEARAAETDAQKEQTLAQARRVDEEAEFLRIQNERERLKLYREQFQLALEMANQLAPEADNAERARIAASLMPSLTTLVRSPLTISEQRADP